MAKSKIRDLTSSFHVSNLKEVEQKVRELRKAIEKVEVTATTGKE